MQVAEEVKARLAIPVAVKLSPHLSALANLALQRERANYMRGLQSWRPDPSGVLG